MKEFYKEWIKWFLLMVGYFIGIIIITIVGGYLGYIIIGEIGACIGAIIFMLFTITGIISWDMYKERIKK